MDNKIGIKNYEKLKDRQEFSYLHGWCLEMLITDILIKRGWQMPNFYHMYHQDEETMKHLFVKCKTVKEIRKYIYNETQVNTQYSNDYIQENN